VTSYVTCHNNITLTITLKYVYMYNIQSIAQNEDSAKIIRRKNYHDGTTFNRTTFNCWFETSVVWQTSKCWFINVRSLETVPPTAVKC